jgi:O-antigen/teichoic acid export membrane protein
MKIKTSTKLGKRFIERTVPENGLSPDQIEYAEYITKKVAKGGGIVLVGSTIGRVINFFSSLLLGRVLGAEYYGLYALGISIINISKQISMLGLPTGLVRFGSIYKGRGELDKLKGSIISAYTISIAASLSATVIMLILAGPISIKIYSKPELSSVIKILALSLPFYAIVLITASIGRAFHKLQYDSFLTGISLPFLNIVFISSAFLLGFRLKGAICALVLSVILSAFLGVLLLKKIYPEFFLDGERAHEARRLVRFSVPVFLEGFSALLLIETDILMLGHFGILSDVGIYNAASKSSIQIAFIMSAVVASFAPIIADLYSKKRLADLKKLFRTTTRWIFSLTLPLGLLLVLFSKNIMSLFGSEFTSGSMFLIILAIAQLVDISTGSVKTILQMSGRQDLDLINGLTMVLLNVILNIWLIKKYGALGAALATTISICLINLVRIVEVNIIFRMNPYDKKYIKPIISGIIMIFFWFLVNRHIELHGIIWVAKAFCLSLSYMLTLFLLGLEKEDKIVLKAIKKRIIYLKRV